MTRSRPAQLNVALFCATLCFSLFGGALAANAANTANAQPPAKPTAPPAPPAAAAPADTPAAPALPRYDKKTEITLKGPIVEVKLIDTASGVQGTHLMLHQGQEMIEVFAGPTTTLTAGGMVFAKGDTVEVIGSKVEINGAPVLLARQIKKGAKSIAMRDENGRPSWLKKP